MVLLIDNIYNNSPTRVISYPLSKRERSFDFKTPVVDLTGRASKHIEPKPSKEYSIFTNIKRKEQPNTSRTLHPDFLVNNLNY